MHDQTLRSKLPPPTAIAGAIGALLLAQAAPLAHAQDSETTTGSDGRAKLEQVVVTANKRVEKLEQVPMAISVMNSELLERNNVKTFEDVTLLSPALSLTYGSTPANNGINMRGIGTSSIGIGVESDVTVTVDDVPMGMQFMAFKDLSDVERVEIIKGPQSTLYGKASIAGAVNIITKPVQGALGGDGSLMVTSDNEIRARSSYGGMLTDTLGFRVALSASDYEGNVTNLTTGHKVNGNQSGSFMGKLVWRPTEALEVQLMPRFNHTVKDCCVLVPTSVSPVQGSLLSNVPQLPGTQLLAGIPIGPNNTTIRNDFPTGLRSNDTGVALRATYDLPGGHQLTSITAMEHYTANDYRDQDFVDVPTLLYYPLANGQPAGVNAGYTQYGTYDIQSKSQELRVASPDSGKLRYVMGLWWGQNEVKRQFIRGYNGIALSTPTEYFGTTYNRNGAVFGQLTYAIRPQDTVLIGARFNHQVSGYEMQLGSPPPAAWAVTSDFKSQNNKENSTTGKVSYQHQFTPSVMAYVMGATGYKGEAYDLTSGLNAQTAAQQPVHSESGRTVEVGLKGNYLDHRLTLNLAAFKSTFSNYQQNSGSYLPGTTTYVTRLSSIGGVQTHGVEADVAALVTPAFLLNASFAYTIATVTEWPNAPCYSVAGSPNGGFNASCMLANPAFGNQNVQDVGGGVMPNAPKYKGTISGQYDVALPSRSYNAFINGALRAQSGIITNINQDPTLGAPGFGIFNLGFGIKDKKSRYKVSFFINNLFDHHYAMTGFTGLGSWSAKAPNPKVTVTTSTWTPARDAFRYEALRVDVKF
ncbi:MAG TPA: TonB-dependent receptor plug domain-containing protein [Burkholderiaceae bacterium]|jgi:iron complex outermembrane receptor protein